MNRNTLETKLAALGFSLSPISTHTRIQASMEGNPGMKWEVQAERMPAIAFKNLREVYRFLDERQIMASISI